MNEDELTKQEEIRKILWQAYHELWRAYRLALGDGGARNELADKIAELKHQVEDVHNEAFIS